MSTTKTIVINTIATFAIVLAVLGTVAIVMPYLYALGLQEVPGTDKFSQADIRSEKMHIAALGFAVSMGYYVVISLLLTVVSAVIFFLTAYFGKCIIRLIGIIYKVLLGFNTLAIAGIFVMSWLT